MFSKEQNVQIHLPADAIVMLTWSNWKTELRSNRYHYATRFLRILPVIFVQPDLKEETYCFEEVDMENFVILHVYEKFNAKQTQLLNTALLEKRCLHPIFWIYNSNFIHFIEKRYSVLNIYHGTEDYLSSDSHIKFKDNQLIQRHLKTLEQCQLIIAVSEGVKSSFVSHLPHYRGKMITISNGCDYSFYSLNALRDSNIDKKIALYQGNIFDKLDFPLIKKLASQMPEWTFRFCGPIMPGWEAKLKTCPNIEYLGVLSPEEVREQCYQATVGLIPFVQNEWLMVRSLPLKTFEYLATGLPVVSIPIQSILKYDNVIDFATDASEFKQKIEKSSVTRWKKEELALRLETAATQDYDIKFEQALEAIHERIEDKGNQEGKLKIAVLYEPYSVKVNTIHEHLSSFALYSRHEIMYFAAGQYLDCEVDLNAFDVIVIHYSIRLSILQGNFTLSQGYVDQIKKFGGYKILFLQDEYEGTEIARVWIETLGIHQIYTCVPTQFKEMIYPNSRYPNVTFIPTLTGYVPFLDVHFAKRRKPLSERAHLIGYRGRALPFWYGSLGQEKLMIGVKVKERCAQKKLAVDIEWDDSKRIYGKDWYAFLENCRATLGTESGANIFDDQGKIKAAIEEKMQLTPNLTYQDIYEEYIAPNETIKMNQISPKIFEAILLKTALILFEGKYSDVLIPDVHFIVLKKDYSNLDEVIAKVQDDTFIMQMTDRAYEDIIVSQKYSYQSFIRQFEEDLKKYISRPPNSGIIQRYHFIEATELKHPPKIASSFCTNIPQNLARLQTISLKPSILVSQQQINWDIETVELKADRMEKAKRFAAKVLPHPVKKVIKNLLVKI